VNTARKVMIVSVDVFLSGYPLFYKGATAIILIVVFTRVQLALEPFKLKINNECELLSYIASLVTLFGGLLYVSDVQKVDFIDLFAFFVIVFVNIYFLLLWLYLVSHAYSRYRYVAKIARFLRYILFRKDDGQAASEGVLTMPAIPKLPRKKLIIPKKKNIRSNKK
jgi:hypothetical protein